MKALRKPLSLLIALSCAPALSHAGAFDQFFDPQDGQLDASQWILDNAHGFLPVPFAITDPAVGVGGGAALLFFHETEQQKAKRVKDPESVQGIPLSVSGVVAGATNNGSYLGGAFHSGNWRDDSVRYLGGIFGASFNLTFYQPDDNQGQKFNMEGIYFLQDIDFRLGKSHFFVGGSYSYMDSKTKFEMPGLVPGVNQFDLDSRDADVSVKLTYDNRDNTFSPEQGTKVGIKASFHDKAFGGDFEYQKYRVFGQHYQKLNDKWGVAVRGDAQAISGDAPFYARPFLEMRGMPALRYQGDNTVLAEAEVSYKVNDRWTVLGFAGTGNAFDSDQSIKDTKWRTSRGAGFRYLIARQLGMKVGIDIAKGPLDWTTHIQFGSAW
ncbi:BamA/TamA family outer membrane protein [Motilimonas pumila]|uniref:BamA/TamA family outer membrane protein n=1 Tax=Motilimonas pumila TaxID=2303987 RepID=UPI0018E0848D|nr:BamA/TamA family outer membrane protein [Motilimonas pumila]